MVTGSGNGALLLFGHGCTGLEMSILMVTGSGNGALLLFGHGGMSILMLSRHFN